MTQLGFSEYGYVVRKPALPLMRSDNSPCSAGEAAELANNLTHLADEAGQVWASDGLITARYKDTDVAATGAVPVLEHMRRIPVANIRVRPVGTGGIGSLSTADGGPYKLIVRVGGAVSIAGSAKFYIIAGPDDPTATGSNATIVQSVALGSATMPANGTSGTTTSTTEAWDSAWSTPFPTNTLTIDPAMLASFARAMPSRDNSGNETSVQVYQLVVDIYGYSATNGAKPRLYGAYVREYVG